MQWVRDSLRVGRTRPPSFSPCGNPYVRMANCPGPAGLRILFDGGISPKIAVRCLRIGRSLTQTQGMLVLAAGKVGRRPSPSSSGSASLRGMDILGCATPWSALMSSAPPAAGAGREIYPSLSPEAPRPDVRPESVS